MRPARRSLVRSARAPFETARVEWSPAVRIVSARSAPEDAFERIASPDEARELLEVLAAGRPSRLDPSEIAPVEGAGWILSAFLYGGAGRFNDETFGAFYAAREEPTALAETHYHYARFLASAREGYTLLGVRVLHAEVAGEPVDIRGGAAAKLAELYDPDPDHYAASQHWAAARRAEGAEGIVYCSVRRSGGECIALFRSRLVASCRTGDRLVYEWDGSRFTATYTLAPRDEAQDA